jgi:hypothetical protein
MLIFNLLELNFARHKGEFVHGRDLVRIHFENHLFFEADLSYYRTLF